MRKKLEWSTSEMGELEARDGQFRYVIWHNRQDHTTELRLIRYDNVGPGFIVPFYDYSLYVADIHAGMKFANKFHRMLHRARRYNGFSALSK